MSVQPILSEIYDSQSEIYDSIAGAFEAFVLQILQNKYHIFLPLPTNDDDPETLLGEIPYKNQPKLCRAQQVRPHQGHPDA